MIINGAHEYNVMCRLNPRRRRPIMLPNTLTNTYAGRGVDGAWRAKAPLSAWQPQQLLRRVVYARASPGGGVGHHPSHQNISWTI